MGNIDLSEWRKDKESLTVTDGNGRAWPLPPFLPATFSVAQLKTGLVEEDPAGVIEAVREMYAVIFGRENVDEAMQAIGLRELNRIIAETYRVSPGESPASDESS